MPLGSRIGELDGVGALISCEAHCDLLEVLGMAMMIPTSAPFAQELEPRLYRNAPVGLNAFALAYGFSQGNVLFDTSRFPSRTWRRISTSCSLPT